MKTTNEIKAIEYSDKSFMVHGDTKPIKEALKDLNGRWNPFLKLNGSIVKGWIFSNKHKEAVETKLKLEVEKK